LTISWGPDSFALIGGTAVAVAFIVFLAVELRHWMRRRAERSEGGPEEDFRNIIHTFNRLDQSVTADSLGSMPAKGSSNSRN